MQARPAWAQELSELAQALMGCAQPSVQESQPRGLQQQSVQEPQGLRQPSSQALHSHVPVQELSGAGGQAPV